MLQYLLDLVSFRFVCASVYRVPVYLNGKVYLCSVRLFVVSCFFVTGTLDCSITIYTVASQLGPFRRTALLKREAYRKKNKERERKSEIVSSQPLPGRQNSDDGLCGSLAFIGSAIKRLVRS